MSYEMTSSEEVSRNTNRLICVSEHFFSQRSSEIEERNVEGILKKVLEEEVLAESRKNGIKKSGRVCYYKYARVVGALIDSSALHVRKILQCLEDSGGKLFMRVKVLSV